MDSDLFFKIVIIGLIVGTAIYSLFFTRSRRIKRKFRKIEETSVDDCKENEIVKIVGELTMLKDPLIAPLSGRKCAVYKIIVEEYRSSGKSGSWIEIIKDKNVTDFLLKQGSSYALIRTFPSELLLNKDANYESGTFNDASPMLENYINRFGEKSKGFLGFNKSMRYKEGILEQGETVAALGKGKWMNADEVRDVELKESVSTGKIFVMEQVDEEKLYVSDEPAIAVTTLT